MNVYLDFLIVAVGFALLIKGADFLVNGSSSLAMKFKVSEMAIGLTIVAMGTSAPELVVNLISGSNGYDEVVFGNIIGSNIFNMFLILGVAGLITPLTVQSETIWKEIPFNLIMVLFFFVLANDHLFNPDAVNRVGFLDGSILLMLFLGFLYYVYYNVKNNKYTVTPDDGIKEYNAIYTLFMIVGGLVGLVIGGRLVVDHSVNIARYFHVSQKLIGLTIIAAGTSLPELATSATAAMRNRSDIAIGNIIGSNIFNLTFILGTNSVVHDLDYDPILNIDLGILLAGTLFLFIFMFTFKRKKLDRWEAFLFLCCFVGYMVYLFIRK